MEKNPIGIAAILLSIFAIIGTGLIAVTNESVKDRIAGEKHKALLVSLNQVIKAESYDNDIVNDTLEVSNKTLLGTTKTLTIYRARKKNKPVAVIISMVAPDGYSGDIDVIAAINMDGSLRGVRVVSHKETPGLGDAIDINKSNWALSFNGRSLTNPNVSGWRVKKDGGVFDQLTGATITPRAIVKAVSKSLQFFKQNQTTIFQFQGKSAPLENADINSIEKVQP